MSRAACRPTGSARRPAGSRAWSGRSDKGSAMQLVRLPPWLYIVLGVVILAAGLVIGRPVLDVAGVIVVVAGIARLVLAR